MKLPPALAAAALATAAAVAVAATLPTMSADAAAPTTGTVAAAAPTTSAAAAVSAKDTTALAAPLPRVRHVFVINLENKGYDKTFRPGSHAPYLRKKLRAKGQLLSQYYGVAHNSLPNYIAQLSGQGPNPQTQSDCHVFSNFIRSGTAAPRTGRRARLRLPEDGAHGRQPAHPARADVEGVHGEHALARAVIPR